MDRIFRICIPEGLACSTPASHQRSYRMTKESSIHETQAIDCSNTNCKSNKEKFIHQRNSHKAKVILMYKSERCESNQYETAVGGSCAVSKINQRRHLSHQSDSGALRRLGISISEKILTPIEIREKSV